MTYDEMLELKDLEKNILISIEGYDKSEKLKKIVNKISKLPYNLQKELLMDIKILIKNQKN